MHIILNYDIFLDNNKLNLSMNKSRHLHTFVNPVISISFLWGKFTVFLSLDSCPHLVIRSFGLYYNRSSLRRDTSLYQLELMLKGFEEQMLYLWHLTPVLVKMGIFFLLQKQINKYEGEMLWLWLQEVWRKGGFSFDFLEHSKETSWSQAKDHHRFLPASNHD